MQGNNQVGLEQLIKGLPVQERVPAVALKTHFHRRQLLDQQQEAQLQVVRRKYDDLTKPLLERASQIIGGSLPTAEEVSSLGEYLKPSQKAGQLKGKIIDKYWNSALQNSHLQQFITQKDERTLQNLLNIQLAQTEPNTISLEFTFKPNQYFNQTSAIRKLRMSGQQIICLEGDLLTPKPGNWLTHQCKKVTNKGNGQTKRIQGKKVDSFFDIFLNWSAVDHPKELQKCADIMQELNLVVRDSLSYFLGLYDIESESQQDLQDYEQDQNE